MDPAPKRVTSVVIRTYNESRHLPRLLETVRRQRLSEDHSVEIVVVDSGSTDGTLEIARAFDCRITEIEKEDFSFGRSLNVGCAFATGEALVFVSGHCIPATDDWLEELVTPLYEKRVHYSYGRQLGAETTKFSESQIFRKYFPEHSLVPQDGFFCNNANAAIAREVWDEHRFDETLTGLEDLELARRLVARGGRIGYVATAPVHHIHDESWAQVRHRYEREALAMQRIAPNLHVTLVDTARFFVSAVLHDVSTALEGERLLGNMREILAFRGMQYIGTYRGNREHRRLSQQMKLRYYYPTTEHHPSTPERYGKPRRSSAI